MFAIIPTSIPVPDGCATDGSVECIGQKKTALELYCCSIGVEAMDHPELCYVYPAPQITMCDIVHLLKFGKG